MPARARDDPGEKQASDVGTTSPTKPTRPLRAMALPVSREPRARRRSFRRSTLRPSGPRAPREQEDVEVPGERVGCDASADDERRDHHDWSQPRIESPPMVQKTIR